MQIKYLLRKSTYHAFYLLIKRTLIYGARYYFDLEFRRKIINKIRNKHVKEKRVAIYGKKEVNRRSNYTRSVKKRILKDSAYGRCETCRIWKPREELTVDHIVPIAMGGKNEKSNMQLLCRSCHTEKTHNDNGTQPNILKTKLSTSKN